MVLIADEPVGGAVSKVKQEKGPAPAAQRPQISKPRHNKKQKFKKRHKKKSK